MSPLFRNVLNTVPFYWIDDLFGVCLGKYPDMRSIWDDVPKFHAVGLIELGGLPGLCAPLSDRARQAIDERRTPVYKLNWRADLTRTGPGSFLDYLFSTVPDVGDERETT